MTIRFDMCWLNPAYGNVIIAFRKQKFEPSEGHKVGSQTGHLPAQSHHHKAVSGGGQLAGAAC